MSTRILIIITLFMSVFCFGYSFGYSPYSEATIHDQLFRVTGRVIVSAESQSQPRRLHFIEGVSGLLQTDGVRMESEIRGDVQLAVTKEQQLQDIPFATFEIKRLTGIDPYEESLHAKQGEMTLVARAMGVEHEVVIPVRVTRHGQDVFVVEPFKGQALPRQLLAGPGSLADLLDWDSAPQHTTYFFKLVLTRQR